MELTVEELRGPAAARADAEAIAKAQLSASMAVHAGLKAVVGEAVPDRWITAEPSVNETSPITALRKELRDARETRSLAREELDRLLAQQRREIEAMKDPVRRSRLFGAPQCFVERRMRPIAPAPIATAAPEEESEGFEDSEAGHRRTVAQDSVMLTQAVKFALGRASRPGGRAAAEIERRGGCPAEGQVLAFVGGSDADSFDGRDHFLCREVGVPR
jgi:hypothetical protein